MWSSLKDGFKEFAADALREGGELVKDTADGTAAVTAKVGERAAVVTETLSKRKMENDRSSDASKNEARETTGTTDGSSTQNPVRPLGIKFKPSGGASGASRRGAPDEPPPRAGDIAKDGQKNKDKQPSDENDVADAVAEAISEAMAQDSQSGQDGESPEHVRVTSVQNNTSTTALTKRTGKQSERRSETARVSLVEDDLRLELDAAKARAAESDRRAVELAVLLAATSETADATHDTQFVLMQKRVKSLKQDNEEQHRVLQDLKKTLRTTNLSLDEAERAAKRAVMEQTADTKAAVKARDDAIRDMVVAENAANALRRDAATSEEASAKTKDGVEKRALETNLALALARAECAETAAALAKVAAGTAEHARHVAEKQSRTASENARQAIAEASAERLDREEANARSKRHKQESERRAAGFDVAVREATCTFRERLEKEVHVALVERDASKKQLAQANALVRGAMERAERAETATRAAEAELSDAAARLETAAAAAQIAKAETETRRVEIAGVRVELDLCTKRAETVETALAETGAGADANRAAAAAAAARAAAAEKNATETTMKLERLKTEAREFETKRRTEKKQTKEQVDALERELDLVRTNLKELELRAASKAATSFDSSSGETKKRPTTRSDATEKKPSVYTFALEGLGLDRVSLSQSEQSSGIGGATVGGGGGLMRRKSKTNEKLRSISAKMPLGAVSPRTWLLVAYLVTLHVMAMFTPRHNIPGCHPLDADAHRLPGL
jgi:hypothetical protein